VPIALAAAAIAMGIALGTIGAGGSILAVPALMYLGGLSPHDATVVSLVVVGSTALVGGVIAARRGLVAWPVIAPIVAGGLIGTTLGASINQRIASWMLLALLGAAMLVAAERMFRAPRYAPHEQGERHLPPTLALLLMGVALGSVTGLLGIGGGFLVIPLLVLFARVPMHHAVGTSLLLIAASALLAVTAHLVLGARVALETWMLGAWVAAAGVAGVIAGGAFGARLPATALRRGFAAGLVPVAALMLIDAARLA
jgi:uncharacterized protein